MDFLRFSFICYSFLTLVAQRLKFPNKGSSWFLEARNEIRDVFQLSSIVCYVFEYTWSEENR